MVSTFFDHLNPGDVQYGFYDSALSNQLISHRLAPFPYDAAFRVLTFGPAVIENMLNMPTMLATLQPAISTTVPDAIDRLYDYAASSRLITMPAPVAPFPTRYNFAQLNYWIGEHFMNHMIGPEMIHLIPMLICGTSGVTPYENIKENASTLSAIFDQTERFPFSSSSNIETSPLLTMLDSDFANLHVGSRFSATTSAVDQTDQMRVVHAEGGFAFLMQAGMVARAIYPIAKDLFHYFTSGPRKESIQEIGRIISGKSSSSVSRVSSLSHMKYISHVPAKFARRIEPQSKEIFSQKSDETTESKQPDVVPVVKSAFSWTR
jgi:hypothetical protein